MLAQATAEVTAALALDLARHAAQAAGPLLFIDATGDRLDELAAAAAAFDPAVAVLALPAWVVGQFDDASGLFSYVSLIV